MKKVPAIAFILALLLGLSACSPSPTALSVDGSKVDASEYAFFLNLNRPSGSKGSAYTPEELETARALALDQITTHEVVRLQCKAHDLRLSDEQQALLAEEKQALIDTLGGKAAYLEYLNSYGLTDRLYDKMQQNTLLYDLLYTHITEELDQAHYGDEALRRYFAENYIVVKYLRISLLDEDGHRVSGEVAAERQRQAYAAHAAIAAGGDFGEVAAEYGDYDDDEALAAAREGVVTSLQEAQGQPWLLRAFDMKSGEVSPVCDMNDGYYIIKRLELSASYFEVNRDYILASAQAYDFSQKLAQWKQDATVKIRKVTEKIDLHNFMEYVK